MSCLTSFYVQICNNQAVYGMQIPLTISDISYLLLYLLFSESREVVHENSSDYVQSQRCHNYKEWNTIQQVDNISYPATTESIDVLNNNEFKLQV